jgi:hypothetical protein
MDNTRRDRCAIAALKRVAEELDGTAGYHAGRFWAEHVAERDWLRRLRDGTGRTTAVDALRNAVDPNKKLTDQQLATTCFGHDAADHDFSEHYVCNFIKGADAFLEKIEPLIPF